MWILFIDLKVKSLSPQIENLRVVIYYFQKQRETRIRKIKYSQDLVVIKLAHILIDILTNDH